MGIYTHYEIRFLDVIDWEDAPLKNFDCKFLYLDNVEKPTVILSLMKPQHNIIEILALFHHLYETKMEYRLYDDGKWIQVGV